MAMRDVDIFQMALGLTPPWEVASCEFFPEKKRLDIRLSFPRSSVFVCPECGRAGLKAYDTLEKTWLCESPGKAGGLPKGIQSFEQRGIFLLECNDFLL